VTRRGCALALVALLGCKSTAAYTVPSALINTALAVGVGAQERAGGGCWAVCAYGTVCDAKSGLCVKEASACGSPCQPWEVCTQDEAAAWRCQPSNAIVTGAHSAGATAPGEVIPGLGVSPATGAAPPLPTDRPGSDGR